MSVAAMTWAKRQKAGGAPEKLVLLVLADYATRGPEDGDDRPQTADGRHYCWAGVERIAEECEMSERSVRRHMDRLAENGFLRKERRTDRSGYRRNDYVILAVDDAGARPFEGGPEPSGQVGLEAMDGLKATGGLKAISGHDSGIEPTESDPGLADTVGRYKENSIPYGTSLRSVPGAEAPQPEVLFEPSRPDVTDPVPALAPVTAQTLVAEHIDALRRRPPGNVVGQIAKQVGQLLAEDFSPDEIRAGLRAMREKQVHPSVLPSLVNDFVNVTPKRPQPVAAAHGGRRFPGQIPQWEQ